jgi:hypothetical protein
VGEAVTKLALTGFTQWNTQAMAKAFAAADPDYHRDRHQPDTGENPRPQLNAWLAMAPVPSKLGVLSPFTSIALLAMGKVKSETLVRCADQLVEAAAWRDDVPVSTDGSFTMHGLAMVAQARLQIDGKRNRYDPAANKQRQHHWMARMANKPTSERFADAVGFAMAVHDHGTKTQRLNANHVMQRLLKNLIGDNLDIQGRVLADLEPVREVMATAFLPPGVSKNLSALLDQATFAEHLAWGQTLVANQDPDMMRSLLQRMEVQRDILRGSPALLSTCEQIRADMAKSRAAEDKKREAWDLLRAELNRFVLGLAGGDKRDDTVRALKM